jgi:hypothetical protein
LAFRQSGGRLSVDDVRQAVVVKKVHQCTLSDSDGNEELSRHRQFKDLRCNELCSAVRDELLDTAVLFAVERDCFFPRSRTSVSLQA